MVGEGVKGPAQGSGRCEHSQSRVRAGGWEGRSGPGEGEGTVCSRAHRGGSADRSSTMTEKPLLKLATARPVGEKQLQFTLNRNAKKTAI